MLFFLSFLLASCYASSVLPEGYELVNGIPLNRNVKADVEYPFCPSTVLTTCTCFQGGMDYLPSFQCNNVPNTDDLVTYFAQLFPTYLVRNITVADSSFTTVPANVFSDKQPVRVSLYNNKIDYINPEAFANTKPKLEILEIEYNPNLKDFPFASLNEFPELRVLNLDYNDIQNLTEIANMNLPKLELLDINFNPNANELPVFPFFSSLRRISVQGSGITMIPKDRPFFLIEVLETLVLADNPLTTIETLTFEFQALAIQTIDLSRCNITTMEENAFLGINSNTQILLEGNHLTTLSSDVFKPVLEILSTGSGIVDVKDNPITCCCEVNWLISDATLQTPLRGAVCAGGAPISGLPLDYLTPLCPPLA